MPKAPDVAFVGPTYSPIAAAHLIERAGFEMMPPAARGDFDALDVGVRRVVLVDGRFNQTLAVGHAEIRRAVERGCEVWGLSSMGAIRAYEMRTLGVRGFGVVYSHFLSADDFQDDEVALLHAGDAPYAAFSEPLIHLRHCLAALERDSVLSRDAATAVAGALKEQWFGDRTMDAFVQTIERYAGADAASHIHAYVTDFDRFRVKTKDLEAFFTRRPWLAGGTPPAPVPVPYIDAVVVDAS